MIYYKNLGTEGVLEVLHVGAVPHREETVSMMTEPSPPILSSKEARCLLAQAALKLVPLSGASTLWLHQ